MKEMKPIIDTFLIRLHERLKKYETTDPEIILS